MAPLFCTGLTLHDSPEDMRDGVVYGVSDELYKKGCVEELSAGMQVMPIQPLWHCPYWPLYNTHPLGR